MKTFTTEKALREYVKNIQNESESAMDFSNRLIKLADDGIHVMDVEDEYSALDLEELI